MNDIKRRVAKLEQAAVRFATELRLALRYVESDAGSSLTKSRIVLERVVIDVYVAEMGREPRKPMLAEMLLDNQFTRKLERRIVARMNAIRDLANLGPHGEAVESSDAAKVLDDLCEVLEWYLRRRSAEFDQGEAQEAALLYATEELPADLSGDWVVTEDYDHGATTGQLSLTQSGSQLSGVLSMVDRDKRNNVVHLEMVVIGATNGATISLRATSVRCIEGKLPHGYELDSWSGEVRDNDTIVGTSEDEGGVGGQFVMRRRA